MVEYENLNLPFYKVSILYRNGDVREFLSNDFERADKEYRKFFSFDVFCSLHDFIEKVTFFNGSNGSTCFLEFV